MRFIVLLFLAAMAAIYASVLVMKPRALQKETGAGAANIDISHPPTSIGSTTFITAPHIAPDAKAAAAK